MSRRWKLRAWVVAPYDPPERVLVVATGTVARDYRRGAWREQLR